jgi:hypothetical protein
MLHSTSGIELELCIRHGLAVHKVKILKIIKIKKNFAAES